MSKCFSCSISKLCIFLSCFILLVTAKPQNIQAIENIPESITKKFNQQTTWNLEADFLNTQTSNTIIEAEGNVILTKASDTFKADFARYYQETNWILLKGNVFISMDQNSMIADEAEFNLIDKTGWILNGKVFMPAPHIYFSSSYIIKHLDNNYTITNGKITTCDGSRPTWSISTEKASIKLDGYTQLYNSTFNIKDISVLYSPIITLPTKKTRQSGLLKPSYGISEKRGLHYTQPYFLDIDQSHDITVYGGFMTKVGPLTSIRYRSHPVTQQKTWFAATGIHSKKVIATPGSNPVYPSSDLVRTNKERYWIRGMADGIIGTSNWRYISNIDYVSDQDYLREFDQGLVSFSRSRSQLFDMFGRDIHEDDQKRLNTILIRNDWEKIGFVLSSYYHQDPSLGHGNRPRSQNELAQQLQRTDFFLYQGKLLPMLPFDGKAHLQSAYIYRSKGTKGWRNEIHPQIILPIDLIYGSAQANLGICETYYLTNVKAKTNPLTPYLIDNKSPKQKGTHRTLLNLDINLYTQANNIWQLRNKNTIKNTPENIGNVYWTALRHNFQPNINYQYMPKKNQNKNPFYTLEDRITSKNIITASFTNIFTRKASTVTIPNEEETTPKLITSFYDVLRWQFSSGYDFKENIRKKYIKNYPKRPFLDILSELEVNVTSWCTYTGKTYLSPYTKEVTRHDHSISYNYNRFINWTTGLSFQGKDYEYQKRLAYQDEIFLTKQKLKLLQNTISIQPTHFLLLTLEDFRNLKEGGKIGKVNSQTIEISYIAQCYKIIGRYRYDGYDKSFTILFELPGIFD